MIFTDSEPNIINITNPDDIAGRYHEIIKIIHAVNHPSLFKSVTQSQLLALHQCELNGSNFLYSLAMNQYLGMRPASHLLTVLKAVELDDVNIYTTFGKQVPGYADGRKMRSLLMIAVDHVGELLSNGSEKLDDLTILIEYLLMQGVDVNEVASVHQHTAAHAVMHWRSFPDAQLKVLSLFAQYSADFTIKNGNGDSIDALVNTNILPVYQSDYFAIKQIASANKDSLVSKPMKVRM